MSGGSFAHPKSENAAAGQNVPTLKLAETNGEAFFKQLGAANLKAARALSAEQIYKALDPASDFRFWPVADGTILTGDPYLLYQAGRFNDTPVLIGTTSDEAAAFGGKSISAADFKKRIQKEYGSQADAILSVYPHATDAEATKSSKGIMRENTFAWPTWTWARLQSQKGTGKAFVYFFTYHTPAAPDGAGHGTDVPYAFQTLGGPQPPSKRDLDLSDLISSYFVIFAATGNPNGHGLPQWPEFNEKEARYMFLNAFPSARPVPNLDKLKAWDAYYSSIREQGKK